MIVPLTDGILPHALADLTARDPRLARTVAVRWVARDAVTGRIAAIDALVRRVLGL